MEETALKLFSQTINDYQKNRQNLLNNLGAVVSEITQTYHEQKECFQQDFTAATNYLVSTVEEIHNKSIIRNKDTSCDFNMLSLFHIEETQHSYLLAHFLNPSLRK